MKVAWATDIHLNFPPRDVAQRFLDTIRSLDADCLLISGDIATAPTLPGWLSRIEEAAGRPVHFTLGNHDFYHGSIASVRAAVRDLVGQSTRLHWLTESGHFRLGDNTALVGHDGWGDGRLGNGLGSDVQLNDFLLIEELSHLDRPQLLQTIQALGDEAARHFRAVLPQALQEAQHILVLTHVPPFAEATWHEGRHSDDNWLPFFACKAVGDVLSGTMLQNPDKRMTVLCGHTHGGGVARILPNLVVRTGPSEYGHPVIQDAFEWD